MKESEGEYCCLYSYIDPPEDMKKSWEWTVRYEAHKTNKGHIHQHGSKLLVHAVYLVLSTETEPIQFEIEPIKIIRKYIANKCNLKYSTQGWNSSAWDKVIWLFALLFLCHCFCLSLLILWCSVYISACLSVSSCISACLCLALSFPFFYGLSITLSLSVLQGPGSEELSGRREEYGENQWFWHVACGTGRRVFSNWRHETDPSKMDCTRGPQLWYSHIQLGLFHTLNTVKQERGTNSHL